MHRDNTEYMRKYRADNPDKLERNRKLNQAVHKARSILVKRHSEEYARILQEVKEELKLL